MDDTRDPSYFKFDIYKKDFINSRESKNCLSSILSAMVTQIANGEPNLTLQTQPDEPAAGSIAEASTEPDSIDDIMDEMFQELKYDLKIEQQPRKKNFYGY